MIKPLRILLLPALFVATLALTGCKTSEEKAEDYYQSGLALLAKGDEDRAMVEFRNVFQYNGFHKEARKTYADVLVKEGKIDEAYSQYLRLIEQYPDTVEVRQTLAELAVDRSDWAEVERHGRAALALTPDAPGLQPIKLVLDYRDATTKLDEAARTKVASEATALLKTQPDSMILRRIVIDRLVSGPDPQQALPVIEVALEQMPQRLDMQMLKLGLLAKSGDIAASGVQLKQMVTLFPDNAEIRTALISWYMVQKDFAGAEAFLRKLAGDPTGSVEGHMALVQFLQATQGTDAVKAELAKLLAANTGSANADIYGALRAMLDFDAGQKDQAVATIEAIVAKAAPSDQTRKIKSMLAQMLDNLKQRDKAQVLVGEVLTEDPGNIPALKLRAAWAIEADRPGDAIVDLRAALNQNPRDAQVLTLMSAAYERDGSMDLAGERLAAAVEATATAAPESLRYAQFLLRQNRPQVAETVLTDARRANPGNTDVLRALAEFYIGQSQWDRALEATNAFAATPLSADGKTAVTRLRAAVLAGQNRLDDSLNMLEEGMSADNTNATVLAVVSTQIRAGKTTEARSYLDKALLKAPKDPTLRLLSGSIDALLGKPELAETTWRQLIAEDAHAEAPVRLLYGLLMASARAPEATAVLDTALQAQPSSTTLRWMKAGELERAGKTEDAIKVYEALYAENSNNTVVANNLASLIASNHDDTASLARAETIARRLRDEKVPAFQETYGWIAFRNGNLDEALQHLEPAAKALSEDALTQIHLGLLYEKLNRPADAIRQFELALKLAETTPTLPQLQLARDALTRLKALEPTPAP